jgi:hypothetical protein
MLNDPLVHEQASEFAERLARWARDPRERIERAFLLAFGRPPRSDEIAEGLRYLDQVQAPFRAAGEPDDEQSAAAWSSYLRVLLSSNEFVFVD